jgi:hypothetical protein
LEQIQQSLGGLSGLLGPDLERFRDDVCGDAVVLAYRGAGPNRSSEDGIILTWCRDPQVASEILDRIDALEKANGELREVITQPYRRGQIKQRRKTDGRVNFVGQVGPILTLSNSESAVREVLDRHVNGQDSGFEKLWNRVGSANSFLTFLLNPRSFDADLKAQRNIAPPAERAFLDTFIGMWSAIDAVVLHIETETNPSLALSLALDLDKFPKPWWRSLSGFVVSVPRSVGLRDPVIARWNGNVELPAIREAIRSLVPNAEWETLAQNVENLLIPFFGRKRVKDLPYRFGNPWILDVSPPVTEDSAIPGVLLAIPLSDSADDLFERQLRLALEYLATSLRVELSRNLDEPIQLTKIKTSGGYEVVSLEHTDFFPQGLAPTFSVQRRHLLLATHPKMFERLAWGASGAQPMPIVEIHLSELRKIRRKISFDWLRLFGLFEKPEDRHLLEALDQLRPMSHIFDAIRISAEFPSQGVLRVTMRAFPRVSEKREPR